MKKNVTILLLAVYILSAAAIAPMESYALDVVDVVDVARGKSGGGSNPGLGAEYINSPYLSEANLTDGNEATFGQVFGNGSTNGRGHMYIDLGTEYKIKHIDVLAYNAISYGRAGDFDIVLSNTAPNNIPASGNPDKVLVAHTPMDAAATSVSIGYKRYTVPIPIADNAYRYVSFEKLLDNVHGLVIQEVKVYTDASEIPFEISETSFKRNGDKLTIDALITNGITEDLTFLIKSYNEDNKTFSMLYHKVILPKGVASYPLREEVDISSLPSGSIDIAAVDNLTDLNLVFYAEDVLGDGKTVQLNPEPPIELSFDTAQNGTSVEISGTAPGSIVMATMLYPGKDFTGITSENINEYAVYFGYTATNAASGEFELSFDMPQNAPGGDYSLRLSLAISEIDIAERTGTFGYVSLADMVEDFETVTADSFFAIADKYEIAFPELFTLVSQVESTIGESFMLAKSCIESGKVNNKVTDLNSADNILTAIKAALLIDKTRNSVSFKETVDNFKDCMPLIFNYYYDGGEFEQILIGLKKILPLTDSQSIITAYKRSAALCAVLNGSYQDIAYALENFAADLDIDKKAITDSGLSFLEIAKQIGNTNKDIGEYFGGMKNKIDNIIADSNQKPSKPVKGGGISGPITVAKFNPSETEQNENSQNIGNTEDKEAPPTFYYDDLEGFDWAQEAILNLTAENIINGTGDATFSPNRYLTREEAAKLIILAFGLEAGSKTNNFIDCDIEQWYYPYVTAASANGIVTGIDRQTFGVGGYISRQDMAVMTDRALVLRGILSDETEPQAFTDIETVAEYAQRSVTMLAAMKVINGMGDGSFSPDTFITRAQAAVIIDKALKLLQPTLVKEAKTP